MSPPRTEFFRRAVRWLFPAAVLALTPKCLVCLLAYAGLGAALGLGGPELCGASGTPDLWAPPLVWLGAAIGLATLGFFAGCRRPRTAPAAGSSAG